MKVNSSDGQLDDGTAVFVRVRPGLLEIASRILGSPGEAEDVIQEAWLRWQAADRAVVLNPPALLKTITVRLALNNAQSAWRRRESSASTWFPDTVDTRASPEAEAEHQEALERAVLLLMETLTPKQRAAYVLREGFGYPYSQISEILYLSAANARQLVARAQKRLAADHRGQPVDASAHRRLVRAFSAAARSGDLAHLEGVLSADAEPPLVVTPRTAGRW